MVGPKLDGPGRMKMATLEDASLLAQRLHGLVERLAMAAQKREPLVSYFQQFRRAAPALVTLLKPQFGMIADHVAQMVVIASRSGSEGIRVRALREGVGQLKLQLELAGTRVKDQHTVTEDKGSAEKG
jgi:hypothetical protein